MVGLKTIMFQKCYRCFKKTRNSNQKSKGLSDKSVKPSATSKTPATVFLQH